MLAACASPQPKAALGKGRSTEYFAESEYGVRASPRVTGKRSRLPRGGGRDQIGEPYKVKGKWYRPQEDPDYHKRGAASWYGDAFHGRLTANGEVYDMTHLTAAHPTMPLPSYARVTNVANGSSVIVRVNDRGPFAGGRIIDLSRRAAELLDYTHAGVAEVEVEYIGRAPLHGRDDQYLMASYRPAGGSAPDQIEPPVMIAMNGPTPMAGIGAAAFAFPVRRQAIVASDPVLPAFGPIAPERPLPDPGVTTVASRGSPALSYADQRIGRATEALAAFASGGMQAADVVASWQRQRDEVQPGYIAGGVFSSPDEAERHVRALSRFGRIETTSFAEGERVWHAVTLHADGHSTPDRMLASAWAADASEAIVVRD